MIHDFVQGPTWRPTWWRLGFSASAIPWHVPLQPKEFNLLVYIIAAIKNLHQPVFDQFPEVYSSEAPPRVRHALRSMRPCKQVSS
jgi:hypothetical protein